jgi:tetratricopeptide (TPR) repeat protein
MQSELKIGDKVVIYMLNLGQNSSDIPTFLIVGYEKTSNTSKDDLDGAYFEEFFASIKSDFENRRFDKAKGRLEMILKQYPNNIDAKLNLCLVQSKTNFYSNAISCYNDILKNNPNNYDALYGLAMAHYSNSGSLKTKAINTINYTTKAIENINRLTNNPKGSLAMLYYNAYFLRGLAKVDINDKTAIDDFYIVHSKQATLMSIDSLNYYKKLLKVD